MSVSFLTPSRTVLLVSDEYLSIFSVTGNKTSLVETVPWEAENFEKNVASIIAKDCGKKPVLILNDMVEQHYRKERVVKTGVNMMDKKSMVKRKVQVAFPNYQMRAAYPLKEKIPKTDKQPAADVYIFAALANSEQISKTIGATKKSLASMAGLCLLPVESSDLVHTLSAKLAPKKKKQYKNSWAIFIGQHRNGSLRQVLTKNGELALTRMSPVVESDDDPQIWAESINQEFKSTIGYLSRFGYDPSDALDVFIIANPAPGEAIRNIVDQDCNLHVMTASEAAKAAGIAIGPQADERFADVLHVAWSGRKSRFTLPLKTAEVDKVSQPRQIAMLAGVLMLGGAAFLGYQALNEFGKLSENLDSINALNRQKSQLDLQYQREVQRLEEVGFDVRLVQSSIEVYDTFENDRIKVLNIFRNVARSLGKDLRIDSIKLDKAEERPALQSWEMPTTNKKAVLYEARLKMTYPPTANVETGNNEVQLLSERIAMLLPDHEVEVSKFLQDYDYTEGLVVEAGDLDTANVQQDFVAEIVIKGIEKPQQEQQL